MDEDTAALANHAHNWYPVQAAGEPPADEWVCIRQGCGYRIMPPAVLAAHDAQVRAELAAELEALAQEWDRAEDADPFAYTGAECAEMLRVKLEKG